MGKIEGIEPPIFPAYRPTLLMLLLAYGYEDHIN